MPSTSSTTDRHRDGHDSAARLLDATGHTELERQLGRWQRRRVILRGLNRYACAALSPQGIYATAICVAIDPVRRTLAWSNAGHPPAVLVRTSGTHETLHSGGCMLGVLEADLYEIAVAEATLEQGDRLLVYTDGATEASDHRGEMFGIDGILAGAWASSGARDPARALAEAVTRFRNGPPRDDLLAVDIAFVGA